MIIVMLLVWGVPSEDTQTNITEGNITAPFVVGSQPQDVPRTIRIGDFSVSYASGSKIINEQNNVNVEKGVFNNKYYKYSVNIDEDMDSVTGSYIIVDILDTNSLGNLVVKINKNIVYNQKVQVGEINIPVDKNYLLSYNVIEISTTGPGWRFWASSFYYIDKIKFGINYYGNLQKQETFTVYDNELQNFKSGSVNFYVTNAEGSGNLMIDINGHNIYKGQPVGEINQPFSIFDVGLIRGQNTISFSAERGSAYDIDDAAIVLTHTETGQKTRYISFDVDSSAYQRLKTKKGTIKFYIIDSNNLGSLLVTIRDSTGNKHPTVTIQSYSIGQLQTITFDSSYVRTGRNTVIFEAAGDGSFVLSNLQITT
jgi:hypothetical protein